MATPIYQLCDTYTERFAELDPLSATSNGLLGYDSEITDYSPEGIEARSELARGTLTQLGELRPENDRDRVAAGFLAERLRSRLSMAEAGEMLRELRIVGSRFQLVRQVFDIMPRANERDWETIATRMARVPAGLAGLRASLSEAAARGVAPARRQVLACSEQGATWAGQRQSRPFFVDLVEKYDGDNEVLRARLDKAAGAATDAFGSISSWLRGDFAPLAPGRDAAGRERYGVTARHCLGSAPDLDETYQWAWEDLHRLEAEMTSVGQQIVPGATVPEVISVLEADPERAIYGEDALRRFLQDLMDRTIEELDGTHFDIPGPLQTVEAMIAPPGSAAAMYYTGPAEDFSRPGRTWYPTMGKTVFPLWGEVSICYHEGVPGHHLQIGYVRFLRDNSHGSSAWKSSAGMPRGGRFMPNASWTSSATSRTPSTGSGSCGHRCCGRCVS